MQQPPGRARLRSAAEIEFTSFKATMFASPRSISAGKSFAKKLVVKIFMLIRARNAPNASSAETGWNNSGTRPAGMRTWCNVGNRCHIGRGSCEFAQERDEPPSSGHPPSPKEPRKLGIRVSSVEFEGLGL